MKMSDEIALKKEFDHNQELYKQIKGIVEFLLSKEISAQRVKTHSIIGDIKTFDSFRDKSRRKKVLNPFEEIHDIVRFRVVCLFLDDIHKIQNIINSTFEVIAEENIIDDLEPRFFGYLGVQFNVRFSDKYSSLTSNNLRDVTFEIQVRTIAQDAWASISHHLDYKKEFGIPDHLKRDFYALSGLFYVADTHFEIMKKEHIKHITSKK